MKKCLHCSDDLEIYLVSDEKWLGRMQSIANQSHNRGGGWRNALNKAEVTGTEVINRAHTADDSSSLNVYVHVHVCVFIGTHVWSSRPSSHIYKPKSNMHLCRGHGIIGCHARPFSPPLCLWLLSVCLSVCVLFGPEWISLATNSHIFSCLLGVSPAICVCWADRKTSRLQPTNWLQFTSSLRQTFTTYSSLQHNKMH